MGTREASAPAPRGWRIGGQCPWRTPRTETPNTPDVLSASVVRAPCVSEILTCMITIWMQIDEFSVINLGSSARCASLHP